MKFKTLLLAVLILLPVNAFALNIVTSTADLAAIAKVVVGDDSVVSMSNANQDPHYVDARPSLTLSLNKADLVVVNGLELEVGWLPSLLKNARNAKVLPGSDGYFDASTTVQLLGITTGKLDRAQGDIHPGGNPHYLHDPRAAARVALGLADRLGKIDPAHRAEYETRAKSFAASANAQAKKWRTKFDGLSVGQRTVVSYHASLPYLYDWLGLKEAITVEPKPGIQPNPGHVAKVLKVMRDQKIGVIVQESYYPTKTSQTLTTMAKGTLVVIPGGTDDSETYLQRVEKTASGVFNALSK